MRGKHAKRARSKAEAIQRYEMAVGELRKIRPGLDRIQLLEAENVRLKKLSKRLEAERDGADSVRIAEQKRVIAELRDLLADAQKEKSEFQQRYETLVDAYVREIDSDPRKGLERLARVFRDDGKLPIVSTNMPSNKITLPREVNDLLEEKRRRGRFFGHMAGRVE